MVTLLPMGQRVSAKADGNETFESFGQFGCLV